ncbi:MAG: type II secretion system protein N [Pseudomonas sp.]|uniref:type II secretion system protein N n=1 Tax=Pseudomonas sp. TaxID=306 RepID=UPI003395331E
MNLWYFPRRFYLWDKWGVRLRCQVWLAWRSDLVWMTFTYLIRACPLVRNAQVTRGAGVCPLIFFGFGHGVVMRGNFIAGKLAPWLCAACLLLLPAFYGFSFWSWRQTLIHETAIASNSVPVAVALGPVVDPANIPPLFGTVNTMPVAAPVKESGLSLKLLASFVSPKGRSAAVLAGGEHKQKLFFAGDEVLPGVELVRVQARQVLIKRNGMLESISLVEGRAVAQPVSTAAVDTVPPSQPRGAVASGLPTARPDLLDKLNKLKSVAGGEL